MTKQSWTTTRRRLVWMLLLGWLTALAVGAATVAADSGGHAGAHTATGPTQVTPAATAAATPAAAPATPGGEGGKSYRVLVSRDGFKLEGGGELTAQAGEPVRITFVYADTDLDYDNPHLIYFPGLEVKSDMLTPENPESTVTLVPTTAGALPFQCVEECNGHKKLQNGVLNVAAGPAPAQPTQLRLDAAPAGKAVNLTATLTTADGQPVGSSQVVFYQAGAFLGAEDIRLGQAVTNPDGQATLAYQPRREGPADIRAVFAGNMAYKASRIATTVDVPTAAVGHYELEPRDLVVPGLGNWILWVVLGAVWGTFGFVVFSAARIPKVAMAGGAGMATPPAQMAMAAAQQAGHLAGTPGGSSTWSPRSSAELKEVKKMEGAFWKLAIGILALLQVATWGVNSYRSNVEHATRVAAESGIRGNLATVAQGLQALQADMQPMLAQQKALTDMLEQQATANKATVDQLAALQGSLGDVKQKVETLQARVQAVQASRSSVTTVPAAPAAPATRSGASTAPDVTAPTPSADPSATAPTAPAAPAAPTTAATAVTAPASPAVVEIPVSAYHYGWDPNVIEVKQGDRVRLVITSDMSRLSPGVASHPEGDEAIHGFGIEAYGIDVEIPPGETATVEFVADQAGEFEIVCSVWCGMSKLDDGTRRGHPDMKGTLIVR